MLEILSVGGSLLRLRRTRSLRRGTLRFEYEGERGLVAERDVAPGTARGA